MTTSRRALLIPPGDEPVTLLDLGATDDTAYNAIRAALDDGWLEPIPTGSIGTPCTVFADEDGLPKKLPPNLRASLFAYRPLVGPVVIIGAGSPDLHGIDEGLQSFLIERDLWPEEDE